MQTPIHYVEILKIGIRIPCTFGYIPLTEPPPFPPLKTVAYQERTPLLGPTVDVDGWVSAKKINISGTLFNSHPVAIECQVCGSIDALITIILMCNTFEALSIGAGEFLIPPSLTVIDL